jgi:hypothetical protein
MNGQKWENKSISPQGLSSFNWVLLVDQGQRAHTGGKIIIIIIINTKKIAIPSTELQEQASFLKAAH